jgi:hypothetical protein
VTSIGSEAFSGCTSLASVTISNNVATINNQTFYNCSKLSSVTIPNSVTSIGEGAFQSCRSLTSISIPSSVTLIGNQAFSGCSGLTSITIPNGITSIGNQVFEGCSKLSSITIPSSVTTIGENAFSNCYKLESVSLSQDLSIIRKQAFSNCRSLKSITFPSKVEFIYQEVFRGCNALESVTALSDIPPFAYTNTFSNYNIPLNVPEESVSQYQSTSPWSNFTTIKTLSGEEPETPQCAMPTIAYRDGKLLFECETEGVEFVSHFTTPASADSNSSEVLLPTTYTVTVYAKKDGYLNSEVATKDIDIRGLAGDTNDDGDITIADAVEIVNIILGNNDASNSRLRSQMKEPK